MYTNVSSLSKQSYRDHHKRHHVIPRIKLPDEGRVSIVSERSHTIKLRRRRRAQETHSFYDNNEDDEDEYIISKWTIVRQRLPDILALSDTYKPTTMRAQLVLLVALMNKQQTELRNESHQLNINDYNNNKSHIVPNNVVIDIGGRSRSVCLKRIPPEQMIHVDCDGLSFAIPTRQFILSISRGYAHETAAKYCPPAISDMLIDISKSKLIDDRRQYKRAQFKMRIGQIMFIATYMLIISVVFALIIGATNTIFRLDSFNQTFPHISIDSTFSRQKTDGFLMRTQNEDTNW